MKLLCSKEVSTGDNKTLAKWQKNWQKKTTFKKTGRQVAKVNMQYLKLVLQLIWI
jgi:hypothetical protein